MKIIILPRVLDKRSINTFGLFPNEQGAGVNFDLDETENFNDLFHSSFDEIASAYNRIISDYFSMSPSLCFPLAKSTIAPIYYVIFERATRLNKLKSKFSSNKLVIPVQSLKYHLKSCTKIDELASNDWEFNGFISYKLAPSFGISSVSYQSLTDEKPKKN